MTGEKRSWQDRASAYLRPPVSNSVVVPEHAPGRSGAGLKLRTLGHASLVLYQEGEDPLLLTDPWLIGSVYWRSWWLQHYPSAEDLFWLARTAVVYITHEHPDHFHPPSIRRLGTRPDYLFPALTQPGYLDYMTGRGFRASVVRPFAWHPIADGVAILSLPVWNDDSVLLIDTPDALILDFNDAKPPGPVVRRIRRLADRIAKRRILLSSYSPASLINSFVDDDGPVTLKGPEDYVAYVSRLCDRVGADFYLPFASQAVFERTDSRWANDFRTNFDHLRQHWTARAALLPPYASLDLRSFDHDRVAPELYRPAPSATIAAATEGRLADEESAAIDAKATASLQRKLNTFRWILWPLFPRGFSFRLGSWLLRYLPRAGALRAVHDEADLGDFVISVPPRTMAEALANDHLSDLGITMFVRIRLLRRIDPRKVYGLFVLFQFDDYGHLRSPAALLRWLWAGLRFTFPRTLPSPPGPPHPPRRAAG